MLSTLKNTIKKSTEYKKFRSVLFNVFEWFYLKFCFGILSHFERKFVKYLFVGLLNTVFSYIIYALAVTITSRPTLSLGISYVIGILFNFQTTGRIVFKNNDNKLLLKFFLSYIATFFINRYALDTLVNTLGADKYLSQAILVFPIAMLSFLILKYFVFPDNKSN